MDDENALLAESHRSELDRAGSSMRKWLRQEKMLISAVRMSRWSPLSLLMMFAEFASRTVKRVRACRLKRGRLPTSPCFVSDPYLSARPTNRIRTSPFARYGQDIHPPIKACCCKQLRYRYYRYGPSSCTPAPSALSTTSSSVSQTRPFIQKRVTSARSCLNFDDNDCFGCCTSLGGL